MENKVDGTFFYNHLKEKIAFLLKDEYWHISTEKVDSKTGGCLIAYRSVNNPIELSGITFSYNLHDNFMCAIRCCQNKTLWFEHFFRRCGLDFAKENIYVLDKGKGLTTEEIIRLYPLALDENVRLLKKGIDFIRDKDKREYVFS
ncbi:MAG: hypothetical protein R2798_05070 [Chitinophagales bacterium]|nr:hypothetical protein [Bacteroidota bacterium]MCB9042715.1 hypothetical protein [Chitinophagales bacterium]